MPSPAPPRPHRRAWLQLCSGLLPLLATGTALLGALGARLSEGVAPLRRATRYAVARVVRPAQPPEGPGVPVSFTDAAGRERTGRLVPADPGTLAPGTEITVRYDPDDDLDGLATVYADGDAATRAVQETAADMAITAGLLLVATVVTVGVVLSRRRLRRRPVSSAPATRLVVRRGLLVRSWLEVGSTGGPRWVPVFWAPELAVHTPDTPIRMHGDPAGGRLVLPVVGGAEVWPSGRVRDRPPRGRQRAPRATRERPRIGMVGQARADAVVVFPAPLLGLLWAYVDGSGRSGFLASTVLIAAVLFWLFQLFGSDPESPARG